MDAARAPPRFRKRKARIAVGYFFNRDEAGRAIEWTSDNVPEAMLPGLDEAAVLHPDLVLLSEMGAREATDATRKTAAMVAERARRMNAYVLIGGLDIDGGRPSRAADQPRLPVDRRGERVFRTTIY